MSDVVIGGARLTPEVPERVPFDIDARQVGKVPPLDVGVYDVVIVTDAGEITFRLNVVDGGK